MDKDIEMTDSGHYNDMLFVNLKEVNQDSIEARLYQIIDDISTAGDMFKPEITSYTRYIDKRIRDAGELITSDGYKLYYNINNEIN